MKKKTVIIGGVAGGATAAARLRRRDDSMEIIILEKGGYISYANCGLPYYIGDVIKSRDALLLQTPEGMKSRFNIDVRTYHEAVTIERELKKVVVLDRRTGLEYEETYDYLVIATGSSPLIPPIPGIDGPDIYTLWSVSDTDMIKAALAEKKAGRAVVVGGGFIGLEMAENLQHAGIKVSLIEMQNQVMAPFDFEMAQLLHENIEMNGVELILGDGVTSFSRDGECTRITLASGREIDTDMVILSIGVRPNGTLAVNAGLNVNEKGGIIVDLHMKTSDEAIYAVGDVAEVENLVLHAPSMIPLAGPANKQARICADHIAGGQGIYEGTLGTSIAKVFDYSAAAVGINEKSLKASGKIKGRDYQTVLINQKSHAGYYPGATQITLKLIFDHTGFIYGAQIVGQDGVDKRIDTIATVMKLKGAVPDLTRLELAYAPPFSSAKDPVNMLGFTAENILNQLTAFISWDEMDQLMAEDPDTVIVDVREDMERMVSQIPGSIHIPLGKLRGRIGELDPNKRVILYCAVGIRSYYASRILRQSGFKQVEVLEGGISFYQSMHYQKNGSLQAVSPAKKASTPSSPSIQPVESLDCCGLQCPGPIMKVSESIGQMKDNEILKVSATDMGFIKDIESWCRQTGNTLLKTERSHTEHIAYISKGSELVNVEQPGALNRQDGKTIVVFSGDLDKALASFIIANGAAAMGRPVTMFFTFWGLNVLRKSERQQVKKTMVEKLFGRMMPRGSRRLKLSKMNFAGFGTKMMQKVMRDKHVDSLEELMSQAMKNGVKFVACTMSMDVMGITKEEMIEGVEFAGVASYLGDAENSNVNLFIS